MAGFAHRRQKVVGGELEAAAVGHCRDSTGAKKYRPVFDIRGFDEQFSAGPDESKFAINRPWSDLLDYFPVERCLQLTVVDKKNRASHGIMMHHHLSLDERSWPHAANYRFCHIRWHALDERCCRHSRALLGRDWTRSAAPQHRRTGITRYSVCNMELLGGHITELLPAGFYKLVREAQIRRWLPMLAGQRLMAIRVCQGAPLAIVNPRDIRRARCRIVGPLEVAPPLIRGFLANVVGHFRSKSLPKPLSIRAGPRFERRVSQMIRPPPCLPKFCPCESGARLSGKSLRTDPTDPSNGVACDI
jgi:hypothetical protein